MLQYSPIQTEYNDNLHSPRFLIDPNDQNMNDLNDMNNMNNNQTHRNLTDRNMKDNKSEYPYSKQQIEEMLKDIVPQPYHEKKKKKSVDEQPITNNIKKRNVSPVLIRIKNELSNKQGNQMNLNLNSNLNLNVNLTSNQNNPNSPIKQYNQQNHYNLQNQYNQQNQNFYIKNNTNINSNYNYNYNYNYNNNNEIFSQKHLARPIEYLTPEKNIQQPNLKLQMVNTILPQNTLFFTPIKSPQAKVYNNIQLPINDQVNRVVQLGNPSVDIYQQHPNQAIIPNQIIQNQYQAIIHNNQVMQYPVTICNNSGLQSAIQNHNIAFHLQNHLQLNQNTNNNMVYYFKIPSDQIFQSPPYLAQKNHYQNNQQIIQPNTVNVGKDLNNKPSKNNFQSNPTDYAFKDLIKSSPKSLSSINVNEIPYFNQNQQTLNTREQRFIEKAPDKSRNIQIAPEMQGIQNSKIENSSYLKRSLIALEKPSKLNR